MKKLLILCFMICISPAYPEQKNEAVQLDLVDGITSVQKFSYETSSGPVSYSVARVTLHDTLSIETKVQDGFVSKIAKQSDALIAINGDFFSNRDNGIIIRNNKVILNTPKRDGMAFTTSGKMIVYNEKTIDFDFLLSIGISHSFSFGPILLQNGEVPNDVDRPYSVDKGKLINGKHPRTAVCMLSSGDFLFVVVDGRNRKYSVGIDLMSLAKLLKRMGCEVGYNLDGGGSSIMYAYGDIVNNPLGIMKERKNGDLIYVK